jgi:hypothetical protein
VPRSSEREGADRTSARPGSHCADRPERKDRAIHLAKPVPLVVLAALTTLTTNEHKTHLPGCREPKPYSAKAARACAQTGRAYWKRTHPFTYTQFELCVANQEAGEPGSTSFSTINWHYDSGYEGAYNWTNETWLAQGGGRYAAHAYEASPQAQTLVFRAHANAHDWPNSVPACGG